MIVVDTNVMVHLLTGSDDYGTRAAALLRTDSDWAAPPILLSELRNVLTGFVRRAWVDLADAKVIHADAVAVVGERLGVVEGSAVLEAADALGLSAYDAEFVVLARHLNCELVSLDREILRAAPETARSL